MPKGTRRRCTMKKNRVKKSRDTVPLPRPIHLGPMLEKRLIKPGFLGIEPGRPICNFVFAYLGNNDAKNIRIVLLGKAIRRLHRKSPKQFYSNSRWMARCRLYPKLVFWVASMTTTCLLPFNIWRDYLTRLYIVFRFKKQIGPFFKFFFCSVNFIFDLHVLFYLWQNTLKFLQISASPFVVVCGNCFKVTWELQTAFLKTLENLHTYSARHINWALEILSLQPSYKWQHREIFLVCVACPLAGSGKILLSWD